MSNDHDTNMAMLKIMAAWVGAVVGGASTLSEVASLRSISIINLNSL